MPLLDNLQSEKWLLESIRNHMACNLSHLLGGTSESPITLRYACTDYVFNSNESVYAKMQELNTAIAEIA